MLFSHLKSEVYIIFICMAEFWCTLFCTAGSVGKDFYGWCRETSFSICAERDWQSTFCITFWQVDIWRTVLPFALHLCHYVILTILLINLQLYTPAWFWLRLQLPDVYKYQFCRLVRQFCWCLCREMVVILYGSPWYFDINVKSSLEYYFTWAFHHHKVNLNFLVIVVVISHSFLFIVPFEQYDSFCYTSEKCSFFVNK